MHSLEREEEKERERERERESEIVRERKRERSVNFSVFLVFKNAFIIALNKSANLLTIWSLQNKYMNPNLMRKKS